MKEITFNVAFTFEGTITVKAKDEDAGREMIETGVGLCLGGDIHTHHADEDIDWEFGSHADLEVQ